MIHRGPVLASPLLATRLQSLIAGAKPVHNYQEAALVFTLGYLDLEEIEYVFDGEGNAISATWSTNKKDRLEQHSTINGYHVRTIPGTRWTKPVMVASGAGRVAVVDRGETFDTIRVTDKYGGAAAQYSADHLLYPNFDWSIIDDIAVLTMPVGYRVTGLQITDREVIVACLAKEDEWSTGRTTRVYTYDLQGYPLWGNIASPDETDLISIQEEAWGGPLVGRPTLINAATAQDKLLIAMVASDAENSAYLLLYNVASRKAVFGRSLPSGYYPIAVTAAQNIVSVLCSQTRSANPNIDPHASSDPTTNTTCFRFFMEDAYATFMRPRFGPNGAVARSFEERDTSSIKDMRVERGNFLQPSTGETVASVAEYVDALTHRRTLFENLTNYGRNLNRAAIVSGLPITETSVSGEVKTKTHTFQSVVSPVSNKQFLIDADCTGNQTTEIYRERLSAAGPMNEEAPTFRSVHTTHMDWLSDGGYTYKSAETA